MRMYRGEGERRTIKGFMRQGGYGIGHSSKGKNFRSLWPNLKGDPDVAAGG